MEPNFRPLTPVDLDIHNPVVEMDAPSTPTHKIIIDVPDPVTPQNQMIKILTYMDDPPFSPLDISPPNIVQSVGLSKFLEQQPSTGGPEPMELDTEMTEAGSSSSSSYTSTDHDQDRDSDFEVLDVDYKPTTTYTEAQLATIRLDWVGTSQILDHVNARMQLDMLLPSITKILRSQFHTLQDMPYDPVAYIEISTSLNRIGFTDVAAGYANRALILIRAGLGIERVACIPRLARKVIRAMEIRHRVSTPLIIENELMVAHAGAYLALLDGLMGCSAYWDGLMVAKEALAHFPGHLDIMDMRSVLLDNFSQHSQYLKGQGLENEEIQGLSRVGKIFYKKYPWLAKDLFYRTPALLREINGHVSQGFGGYGNCELRPVVFDKIKEPKTAAEGEDVGPCGIFATRDITEGEPVMIDATVVGLSKVSPWTLRHCEACNACVFPPYCTGGEVLAKCCKKVIYCSAACAETAKAGYHAALCGKNTEYAYNLANELDSAWRCTIFQRAAAVIIGDRKNGKYNGHPLQHPLVARLTASNFTPRAGEIQPPASQAQSFYYKECVIAPTKILLELGIDIFASAADWAPEVLSTIIMRLDNNANQANTDIEPGSGTLLRTINLNPQYVFFNHSCEPNVDWSSVQPFYGKTFDEVAQTTEIYRPAKSTVFCNALRDIKKGDQLFISYIGDPLGEKFDAQKAKEGRAKQDKGSSVVPTMSREENRVWMSKWFDNGCGCQTCETENRDLEALVRRVSLEQQKYEISLPRVTTEFAAMDIDYSAAVGV